MKIRRLDTEWQDGNELKVTMQFDKGIRFTRYLDRADGAKVEAAIEVILTAMQEPYAQTQGAKQALGNSLEATIHKEEKS